MLSHIHLRNFTIVEETQLDLNSGLTVLTGETGAGKSILIDAIGLVLGDRADSGVVRYGTDKTEITLTVDLADCPSASNWLVENELSTGDDECILRRVITSAGKSKAWINGTPSNLKMLKALGEQLVDIHGQHEHQSLMKNEFQRKLIDDFGGSHSQVRTVSEIYAEWKEAQQRLVQVKEQSREFQSRIDLLTFQIGELSELGLSEDEIIGLDDEHNRLSNAEHLINTVGVSYSTLYEDDLSISTRLGTITASLEDIAGLDSAIQSPLEMLESAQIQIEEAAKELRDHGDKLVVDPERLQFVSAKVVEVQSLSRKHYVLPEELPKVLKDAGDELISLNSDEYDVDALKAKVMQLQSKFMKAASVLTNLRIDAARDLSDGVSKAMQDLGMTGGVFDVSITSRETGKLSATGMDVIEFQVSANPGQPLKSMVKVASGGELSRISLAIQMIAAQKMTLPALIFDEVDTGIGGGIAEVVGKELRALGKDRQVLCVTHLPQVASQGHHHYLVKKSKGEVSTSNEIHPLDHSDRVKELARMIGGIEMTDSTLKLAEEMIQNQAG